MNLEGLVIGTVHAILVEGVGITLEGIKLRWVLVVIVVALLPWVLLLVDGAQVARIHLRHRYGIVNEHVRLTLQIQRPQRQLGHTQDASRCW